MNGIRLLMIAALVAGFAAPSAGARQGGAPRYAGDVAPPWAPPAGSAAVLEMEDVEARLETLSGLHAAGRHEQVIRQADALLSSLPPEARAVAWEVPFNRRIPIDALLGRRYGYFVIQAPRQWYMAHDGSFGVDEGRPDLPVIEGGARGREDASATITCVDLASGRRLWSRGYQSTIALDPRDDALWTWSAGDGARAMRWDPLTGETTREVALPPVEDSLRRIGNGPAALRQDGVLIGRGKELGAEEGFLVFDLDTKRHEHILHDPARLSRNGLGVLERTTAEDGDTLVTLRPAFPDTRPIWSTPIGGWSVHQPVWLPGGEEGSADVLMLAGGPEQHGAVYRLDGETGEIRWQTPLPEPAFAPAHATFPFGFRQKEGWTPIGLAGDHIVAIGSFNTLFFLDPRDGRIVAARKGPGPMLALPRIAEGRLVMAGFEGMCAVPLNALFQPDETPQVRTSLIKVRSLLALERWGDAAISARQLIDLAPNSAEAWRALAEATERSPSAFDRAEVPAMWARYMALAGLETLPELERSHGLIRRIPTGGIIAPLVPGDVAVLAGTLGGELLTIDARSGEIVASDPIPTAARSLVLRGNELYTLGWRFRRIHLRTFVRVPDLPRGDPLVGWLNPEDEPGPLTARMVMLSGPPGPQEFNGTIVHPIHGGGVRLQAADGDPGEFRDLPPVIQGVDAWKLTRGGSRPLAYSRTAVWEVDEHFRPARLLVSLPDGDIEEVIGDENAIAILTGPPQWAALQIWSADGGRLLRRSPLPSAEAIRPPDAPLAGRTSRPRQQTRPPVGGRMMRLGHGVLWWSDGLAWVPDDPQKPRWRWDLGVSFGPPRPRDSNAYPHTTRLGIPRIVEGNLFVASEGGGIYVFSIDRIIDPS